MGEILLAGVLSQGWDPQDITVADRLPERLQELSNRYKVRVAASNQMATEAARLVILAVKPQDLGALLDEISGAASAGQTFVSIAAGVTCRFIEKHLPHETMVVRAMPNAPASVGTGVTAICAGACAGNEQLDLAEALFAQVGKVIRVDENQMNAVTAVSGSGPAYFALFIEAIIESGVNLGLDPATSADLAVQTMLGTSLMLQGGATPGQIITAVASPKGTTEAALVVLEAAAFKKTAALAVTAAARRAQELSRD